jgi:hypothetical protein
VYDAPIDPKDDDVVADYLAKLQIIIGSSAFYERSGGARASSERSPTGNRGGKALRATQIP